MSEHWLTVWRDLSSGPIFWLTVTLIVYQATAWLYQRTRQFPLFNPVLASIAVLVGLLLATGTPYETYFKGAQLVHFLLGPATVALAVPLYGYLGKLKRLAAPIAGALLIGSAFAILSAVGIAWALGASPVTLRSLATKSVTTPIAMGIAETVGGAPALAAVLVILTGIIGALSAKTVLRLIRQDDPAVRGFAIGLTAHGLGTAHAFQMHPESGAFSGLAMGLNGIITTFLAPLLLKLLGLL